MNHNSLFGNIPVTTGRVSGKAPNKSNKPKSDLFGNVKPREREMVVTPRDTERFADNHSIPKVGETVLVLNINNGIEGTVQFIDMPNLYSDHFFPIQLIIPKLGDMMVRTRFQDIRRKRAITDANKR